MSEGDFDSGLGQGIGIVLGVILAIIVLVVVLFGFKAATKCKTCDGTGRVMAGLFECAKCNGRGVLGD